MKYLLVILLGLSVSGCYYAPYDPYYGTYPAYGAYYGPAYYPAPAVVSVGVGGYGGYYGHRYWR